MPQARDLSLAQQLQSIFEVAEERMRENAFEEYADRPQTASAACEMQRVHMGTVGRNQTVLFEGEVRKE